MVTRLIGLIFTFLSLIGYSESVACNTESIPAPQLFGIQVLELLVEERRDYDASADVGTLPPFSINPRPLNFCSVTIKHTHAGLNDTIHTYIWLPLDDWNGNFMAQGGGGWAAGMLDSLAAPVNRGYATAITDGGHSILGHPLDNAFKSDSWALASPGNIDLVTFQDFAYRALDDMTHLSKAIIETFYGKKAKYSYWHGCSTGGRQGMVQAQRYPKNYDGILSAAPAINWATFVVTMNWGYTKMHTLDYVPPPCELDTITAAAIEACDALDGVKDGVISAPGLCKFDPETLIGKKFDCNGERRKITKEAVQIASAIWQGPIRNPEGGGGKASWFGATHETSLNGHAPLSLGLASTRCDAKNRKCAPEPFPVSRDWVRYFVAKDPEFDTMAMSEEEFFEALSASRREYYSMIDTADPDLNAFKAAGGKMIHWHGLADQLIFPNGSSSYYERVRQFVPDVQSFYRYFEVPGIAHCTGGPGVYPAYALDALVDWVEKGVAPEQLDGVTWPATLEENTKTRPLCPYPLVAAYKGGDPDKAASFECAESFGKYGKDRDEL